MTRKPLGSFKQVMGPPDDGGSWAYLTRELIASPAWRARSIHCVRLLDFLILEHLAHGARENGQIKATYGQLEKSGIGRRFIAGAIEEAEALRLIKVERGGRCAQALDHMSIYTLTFYGTKSRDNHHEYYVTSSNDWRRVGYDDVKRIKENLRKARNRRNAKRPSPFSKNNSAGAPMVHQVSAPVVNLDQYTRGAPSSQKAQETRVHHG